MWQTMVLYTFYLENNTWTLMTSNNAQAKSWINPTDKAIFMLSNLSGWFVINLIALVKSWKMPLMLRCIARETMNLDKNRLNLSNPFRGSKSEVSWNSARRHHMRQAWRVKRSAQV